MPGRPARLASNRVSTRALVLRRTVVGDADLMVQLFTDELGALSATARGARRPSSKLGALEPMHTLVVGLDVRQGNDVAKLGEARIEVARVKLLETQAALDAAFKALVWVRSVLHPLHPERGVFALLLRLLDSLERGAPDPDTQLAAAGLGMLTELGYQLALDACVRCGRACPANAPAWVDPALGGLVCRDCESAPTRGGFLIPARLRHLMMILQRGEETTLARDEQRIALEVVEATFRAHALRPQRESAPR